MTIFNFLTLIGGLALFLFGMQIMGDGLQRVSGSKLEQILERLTNTPIKGVLLGAGVTAVIQSSSATTVMVVGFVNSGIMQLRQVVGIIMGANLGTTVTAWILSLAGIEGTSFLAMMCKPTSFAPLLAFIGIIMYLFSKSDKAKDVGTIFLGFTVLMFGMDFMSDAVSPLAESPAFGELLVKFSNPLLGIIAGAVITAILQSSSASVGILQALAITGILPFSAAIPIIMGQNIGTCVTALLSCIGTSTNAKRAAMVHLYFNVLGTIIFLILFYTASAFLDFAFLSGNITASQIAIVHTTFNIVATCCLLPFASVLERLACATVRGPKGTPIADKKVVSLEERFLSTPAFAVEHCKSVMEDMMAEVKQNLMDVVKLNGKFDTDLYMEITAREKLIDEYEHNVNDYLLKLNKTNLSVKDSTEVSIMLNSVSDLERIGDHAFAVANTLNESAANGEEFSRWGKAELTVLNAAVIDATNRAFRAFTENDVELAKSVRPLEDAIDGIREELKRRHIRRLQKGECTVKLGLHFIDIVDSMERISDYGAVLAGYVLHDNDDNFNSHRYMKTISDEDRALYRRAYDEYSTLYMLPDMDEA
ncbi:MAG: Na/Pi cotransporter family protein [Firmicutes bacterium]|nr:Na/Pi cotransporter family protein [Bacillota bacterium]